MPLAHFPARPTTARTEIQQPRRFRVRSIAGTAALIVGLIGSGGGAAAAAVAATPQAPAQAPAPAPSQAAAPAAPNIGGITTPRIADSATGASIRSARTEVRPSRLSQLVRHWVKALRARCGLPR